MRSVVVAYVTLILPTVGTIVAIVTWSSDRKLMFATLLSTCFFFVSTSLGLTAGFHRLFTHRSFTTSRWIRIALGVAGSMAAQGPLLYWVGAHRVHHQHSDISGKDPHSPLEYEHAIAGRVKGLLHAHVGWMLTGTTYHARYCRDLLGDSDARFVNSMYPLWILLGLVAPSVFTEFCCPHCPWAWAHGFLWGGLVRILLVHHTTWSVNSICHSFGYRNYETRDNSRNNALVAWLTFGEGWHNNHHAFPASARHGIRTWELDATWMFICFLESLGLATDVVVPTKPDDLTNKLLVSVGLASGWGAYR